MNSLSVIVEQLTSAADLLTEVNHFDLARLPIDDRDNALATCKVMLDLCESIESITRTIARAALHRHQDLRRESRTENEMVNYIAKRIENKVRSQPATSDVFSGGLEAAAKRNAHGKCELCAAEFRLTVHHVIARAEGGLDVLENYVVICQTCHDEIEDCGYHTRAEVLRHTSERPRLNTVRLAPVAQARSAEPSAAEKAEATRQANQAARDQAEREVETWAARWQAMSDSIVPYYRLGDELPTRPEKPWHVLAYGAGKTSALLKNA